MSITLNITINLKVLIAIIFIIIITLILIYKKNEHLFVGTEPVINISKVYADASGTVNFNNINLAGNITAKDISANNIIAKDISANGTLNGYNLTMHGVDMRYYLTGVTLYDVDPDLSVVKFQYNSLSKVDFHLGHYSTDLGDGGDWGEMADVAVIYPGFGADFWTGHMDSTTCKIDNYGLKPLRIKFGSPPTVLAGSSSDQSLYNIDSNTYEITGTGVNRNELSSLLVRFVSDDAKWRKHKIN
jgi:hypothetical protein